MDIGILSWAQVLVTGARAELLQAILDHAGPAEPCDLVFWLDERDAEWLRELERQSADPAVKEQVQVILRAVRARGGLTVELG